jgi:hypothetical protein
MLYIKKNWTVISPQATTCRDGTSNWSAMTNKKHTLSMDWDSQQRNKCGEIKLN